MKTDQPLKERLLSLLKETDTPLALAEINEQLGGTDGKDYTALAKLVVTLERKGELILSESGKVSLPLLHRQFEGLYNQNKKGFGFVRLGESESDIFVPRESTHGAMNNDEVVVVVTAEGDASQNQNPEGEIVHIKERNVSQLTGEFIPYNDRLRKQTGYIGGVKPLNKGLDQMTCFLSDKGLHPVEGEIVVVDITEYPTAEEPFQVVGVAKQSLGHKDEPGADILAILSMFGIPSEFPEDVQAEAEAVPETITDQERRGRMDYRDALTITIDGAESKDLDDAIALKTLENGNYELGVHIADVSHYVTEGSAIDREALNRGTSVYLTDRVVPMLPQRLSNGICSLNEGQERLTMSCVMEITPDGRIVDYQIGPSLIQSDHRMTYKDVNTLLAGDDTELEAKYSDILPMLRGMATLHNRLEGNRHQRGAIDFDTPEAKIIVDEDGHPTNIQVRERGVGERMIESFMLAANETVAHEYTKRHLPFLFRIHESPDEERIKNFQVFAQTLGVQMSLTDGKATPKDLQQVLARVEDKPFRPVIQMMLLRSMQQARYDVEPVGHYGIAAEDYTHFTSPIRRYPDLIVHRLIRKYLTTTPNEQEQEALTEELQDIASQSSKMERRSIDAERETDSLKKAEYMQDQVGNEFDAIVSSVTNFGMFVELANTVEGLIHLSTIHEDYFNFDRDHLLLIGEHTGKIYHIGDPVRVKLISADPTTRQIDFQLVKDEKKTHANRPKSKGRRKPTPGKKKPGKAGQGKKKTSNHKGKKGGYKESPHKGKKTNGNKPNKTNKHSKRKGKRKGANFKIKKR
ncbi:MAG: ribonuclease R [Aerococcus sp.]|nr:ribonuclease R [Aerococcus sp.]